MDAYLAERREAGKDADRTYTLHETGDNSSRSLAIATLFGIDSSSCSYAAVAIARSLFLKGASFTAAMDMSVTAGPLLARIASGTGHDAISHHFVMEWASVWQDIALGFLIVGLGLGLFC